MSVIKLSLLVLAIFIPIDIYIAEAHLIIPTIMITACLTVTIFRARKYEEFKRMLLNIAKTIMFIMGCIKIAFVLAVCYIIVALILGWRIIPWMS